MTGHVIQLPSGRIVGTGAPARDDGRGADHHADAWGAFASLGALPPVSEWQLRWYGVDKAWQV